MVYRQHRRREVETINETRKRNTTNETFYPLRFNNKDETNLRNIPEKNTLMGTLMLTNKEILLCYEASIKKHLFKKEVVEFGNNKFRRINRFTSLEKFLKKAEELGIHYTRLGKVFEVYAELCMPQVQYLLAQTRGNTRKNWDTILERLTVQKELSAINNDLRKIVRYPGREHNNLILKFYDRLYCLYLTAAHIQFQESEARDSNLTEDEIFDKINHRTQNNTLQALINLTRERAIKHNKYRQRSRSNSFARDNDYNKNRSSNRKNCKCKSTSNSRDNTFHPKA